MSLLFHFHQKFYHAITDTRKMFPVWAEIAIPGFLLFYIFLSFWKQIKAFFSDTSAFLSAPPVTPFAIFRLIICILRATHLSTYPFCSSSTSIKKRRIQTSPAYIRPSRSFSFLIFSYVSDTKGNFRSPHLPAATGTSRQGGVCRLLSLEYPGLVFPVFPHLVFPVTLPSCLS